MSSSHQIVTGKKYNYADYKDLVFYSANSNSTTGPEQTAERIEATKLNAQRMKRIDKTIRINPTLSSLIGGLDKKWDWVVIAESWCGDGAQNIPIIASMAALNANIHLKIILRDESPDLMDAHLTGGSRSIPILICYDALSGNEIGLWGPRPDHIAELVKQFKKDNPGVPHAEFLKHLHLWYARDRGESIQKDFMNLIPLWKGAAIH